MSSAAELPQAGQRSGAVGLPARPHYSPPPDAALQPGLPALLFGVGSAAQGRRSIRIVLCDALGVLRAEGYAVVSLSGGEPLVYRPLRAVVERAKELGFRVTMISNGLLATAANGRRCWRCSTVSRSASTGWPDSHNALRGRPDAFERACAALERLAANGTSRRCGDLADPRRDSRVAGPRRPPREPRCAGARRSVRSPAPAARARWPRARSIAPATMRGCTSWCSRSSRSCRPTFGCIATWRPAQGLWEQRDAYAGLLGGCDALPDEDRPLAELVNPLVITETGALKPIAYDFDHRFDVAAIDGLSSGGLQDYKQRHLPRCRRSSAAPSRACATATTSSTGSITAPGSARPGRLRPRPPLQRLPPPRTGGSRLCVPTSARAGRGCCGSRSRR